MMFDRLFLGLALLATFFAPALIGELAPYLFFALALPAVLWTLFRPARPRFCLDLIGKTMLAVFVVQLVLAAISAKELGDIAFGLNFTPLLFYLPAAAIFARVELRDPVTFLASAALTAAILAAVTAMVSAYGFGNPRAGMPLVNPLGLAGTALNTGALALIGLCAITRDSGRWRLVYLLGPVAALVAILITDARGSLLAWPVLVLLASAFLLPHRLVFWAIPATLALGLGLVAYLLPIIFDMTRLFSVIDSVAAILSGGEVTDMSTLVRLELYRAGLEAFWQAPLFGHGWSHIMDAVLPFLPAGAVREQSLALAHLHNDVVDFLVTGGIMGLLTYLAIILAPLILAAGTPRDRFRAARRLGITLIVASYLVRGLTDLMFGMEANALYYIIFLALLTGLCRDRPSAAAGDAQGLGPSISSGRTSSSNSASVT